MTNQKKNTLLKTLLIGAKEYILLSIGILIYTLGWVVFIIPNNLVGGGATGISTILHYAIGLDIGLSYFVLNVILLIIGTIFLGKGFGFKTIYAIFLASFLLSALGKIIPLEIIEILTLSNGKLMCTIIGGIMAGTGIGMSISQGGSSGGTDIIALVVNKYKSISPGRMILLMDVLIILSSLLVPSYTPEGVLLPWEEKIGVVVYGLLLVTINGYVVDLYLSGFNRSVQFFIFTKKYEEVADVMMNKLNKGVTILDGMGWYTKDQKKVIMLITRKADLNIILKTVKSIDPNAFLSLSSVAGVYGKGFDTIKLKSKEGKA